MSAALVGCGPNIEPDRPPPRDIDVPAVRDAIPRPEPLSPYGNPAWYVVNGKRYYTLKSAAGFNERGIASWYGSDFHGRRTSSGETYDMYKMTAAHQRLPLPTYVRVTNMENGRTAVLKVNDRGPFHDNRIVDVSYAAALKLGMRERGTAFVEITALTSGGKPAPVMMAAAPPGRAGEELGMFLQIGAFVRLDNAQKLTRRVVGYVPTGVQIRKGSHNGQSLYRVQIGPIKTVDLADRIVASLAQIGVTEHHFVSGL